MLEIPQFLAFFDCVDVFSIIISYRIVKGWYDLTLED